LRAEFLTRRRRGAEKTLGKLTLRWIDALWVGLS
jgi:hypothetical protein